MLVDSSATIIMSARYLTQPRRGEREREREREREKWNRNGEKQRERQRQRQRESMNKYNHPQLVWDLKTIKKI